ncbi:DUF1707 SHOCT-like domain-containing protein [Nocardioides sp. Iso805N]|uniref:DUF1707 SHOCT-like domain-containing protein n=1 Tax=Nocardioides sp. Iso805N TaxID=1283287 RepID=UPI0003814264|nr:DUF1707 domain-containing protein [Nocardioides sp. Iso805N]
MGDLDRPERNDGRDARPAVRIGDAERHEVTEILRQAAGEGRLTLEELDERLEAAYGAKTAADLVPLTEDLPTPYSPPYSPPPAPATPSRPVIAHGHLPAEPERHRAVLSGFERKGVWQVPVAMQVTAVLGGASLDLRQATYAAETCELTVQAFWGGVTLIVPPEVEVVFEMTSVLGGYSDTRGNVATTGSPRLVIRGWCVMGGVSVERR